MASCTAYAATQAQLDTCKNTNAKTQLATSLGLTTSEVTAQLLNEYMDDAATEAIDNSVTSCMSAATSAEERSFCVTGDAAKSVLAKSLGILTADLGAGELEEFVVDAAVEKALDVIDQCMSSISTSLDATATAAAKSACRTTTGCDTLAPALGLLTTELTKAECFGYLDMAASNHIDSKMQSCIAAIDSSLSASDQAAARGTCKTTTAKAGLASVLGVDVADISSEELQDYVLESALSTKLPNVMSACISGIDSTASTSVKAAARTACRTTSAKTAYAS